MHIEMSEVDELYGLSGEQLGRVRVLNRLLISYNDFKQTHEISGLLLEGDLYEKYPRENRHLTIALNMAAVVAYSRPFVKNRGELAHNRLPSGVLRILTEREREIHDIVLEDRHRMMAHSDADANGSIPLVMETGNSKILVPKNANAYETLLLPEAMSVLHAMAYKLQERCFELREEMLPELIDILPRATSV